MIDSKTPADSGIHYAPEAPHDEIVVETLLDHAFGPGRFVKSSERVREFAEFRPDFSVCAWEGSRLVGSVRMWRVHVGADEVIFLGPLAVEADVRKHQIGAHLVERAVAAAEAGGFPIVLLVGDEPYFGRFGFSAKGTAEVRMPGPVDQRRVLARGAEKLAGDVTA